MNNKITFKDVLGWEEGFEYEDDGGFKYRYRNGKVEQCDRYGDWFWIRYAWNDDNLNMLKNCKKVEEKKYYLKLKEVYGDFFNINYDLVYINYECEGKEYIMQDGDNVRNYKTQFTEKEIEEIKLPEPLTLDMFDKVEVKELKR